MVPYVQAVCILPEKASASPFWIFRWCWGISEYFLEVNNEVRICCKEVRNSRFIPSMYLTWNMYDMKYILIERAISISSCNNSYNSYCRHFLSEQVDHFYFVLFISKRTFLLKWYGCFHWSWHQQVLFLFSSLCSTHFIVMASL